MAPNNNRLLKFYYPTQPSQIWLNPHVDGLIVWLLHKTEYVLVGSHKCERVLLNPRYSPNTLLNYHALVFYHKPKTKVVTSVVHVYCF
jgi:hypothetical protein